MIPSDILNLILQIPIVAAFIWFSLQTQKQNAEAMTRRDEDWRKFLADQQERYQQTLTAIVDKNNTQLGEVCTQVGALAIQIEKLSRVPLLKRKEADA